ncbi:hypothetical protein [Limosilactobacillus sp.]|uniref:hypothetical protein n=1 Tax=Limosilactobacillus sp. TaxID=2773925 RepID=UPI002A807F6F|nr:hypothetical protein [Limosilactobacillus sp.]MDY4865156.1 hypothetical protein [Limosilactobacillus sp.]
MKWLMIILTVLFTAAKLVGLVTWSWWLVFLPTLILVGFWLFVFIVAVVVQILKEC